MNEPVSPDKVFVVSSNPKKPSFFKRMRPPLTGFSTKNLAAGILVAVLVIGIGAGVMLSQKPQTLSPKASVQTAQISLRPGEVRVMTNNEFQVDLFLDSAQIPLKNATVDVRFDPRYLQVKRVEQKGLLPVIPSFSPNGDTISLESNSSDTKAVSGILTTFTFKAKDSVAQTEISLTNTILKNSNSEEITSNNSSVKVNISK